VRWFNYPETKDFLRITIGSDEEMNALLKAAREILFRQRMGTMNGGGVPMDRNQGSTESRSTWFR